MSKLQLDPHYLSIVKDIVKTNIPDHAVFVFGSRAKGTAKPHSDLDLCLSGKEKITLSQFIILKEAFSESDLPMRVDIVDAQSISPQFKRLIEENCIKLY